jgi:putative ABC transport system permease protein
VEGTARWRRFWRRIGAALIPGRVERSGRELVALGSLIGLILAAGASRILAGLLYAVPAFDPASFAGATPLFAVVGLAACYLPAHRTTPIDAMEALRYE